MIIVSVVPGLLPKELLFADNGPVYDEIDNFPCLYYGGNRLIILAAAFCRQNDEIRSTD